VVQQHELIRVKQFIPLFIKRASHPELKLEVSSREPGQIPYAIFLILPKDDI
jgi:hypothetical protein